MLWKVVDMGRLDGTIARLAEIDIQPLREQELAKRRVAWSRWQARNPSKSYPRPHRSRKEEVRLRRHFIQLGIPCQRCGSTLQLEVSHNTPAIDGGSYDLSNVEWLCHSCHVSKDDRWA